MSRKTSIKALVLAGAVAGSVLAVGSPASAAAPTITKVSPAKVALKIAAPITITGTNFDNTLTKVQFGADADCASSSVVVMSATTLYVTAPTSADCVAGLQAVQLFADTVAAGSAFTGTATTGVSFVAPVVTTGTTFTPALAPVGSPIAVTGLTVPTGGTVTLGGKPVTLTGTAGNYKTTVPAGLAPGAYKLVVTSETVSSSPSTSALTVKAALKVLPTSWVSGTTKPALVLTGLGFLPTAGAKVYASVCGMDAAVATVVSGTGVAATKAPTNTVIYVTPPDFAAAGSTVTAADGGVCSVKVTVDPSGSDVTGVVSGVRTVTDGGTPDNYSSVITAGSTFTYAAF